MSAQLENALRRLLRLRDGSENILRTRESTQIEFKQSFGFGNMPEYARTMAAYANTEGGFLVFGVRNAPHELVGLTSPRFDSIDPARVSTFLNSHCIPEIQWEFGTVEVYGVRLGFLYTFPHTRKPVIVTATSGKELKEGDIYYRYRGQTTTIKYSELRMIIDGLLDQERRAWLQHLSTITKAGAVNVAVLDTLQGKLYGAGAPFLIDEALLRQIKFIREGQFTEAAGAPTLRLVGEVRTVSGVTTTQVVQRGIHFEDLVTAFLAARPLSEEDAKSYLIESCHQMSPYAPIFYFVRQAQLSPSEAAQFLKDAKCGLRNTRNTIIQRLSYETLVKAMNSIDETSGTSPTASTIGNALEAAKGLKEKRSVLWRYLSTSPEDLFVALPSIPVKPLLEAVTHLEGSIIVMHADTLKQLLLTLFGTEFQRLNGAGQSIFRRAVAYLDQELYAPDKYT